MFMDLQETIESLRKLIEGAIAPSIREVQVRLNGLDKDVQDLRGEVRETNARIERLEIRMDNGMADLRGEVREVNARLETGMADLRGEIRGVNGRLDTLITAMLSSRQPAYPDAVLSRLDQLEKAVAHQGRSSSE